VVAQCVGFSACPARYGRHLLRFAELALEQLRVDRGQVALVVCDGAAEIEELASERGKVRLELPWGLRSQSSDLPGEFRESGLRRLRALRKAACLVEDRADDPRCQFALVTKEGARARVLPIDALERRKRRR